MAFANAPEDEKVRKPGSESAEVLNANQQEELEVNLRPKHKKKKEEQTKNAGSQARPRGGAG